jgi:EAL domain-containing protein (putative c-di-GMP-specific phosphodiesterase class I)
MSVCGNTGSGVFQVSQSLYANGMKIAYFDFLVLETINLKIPYTGLIMLKSEIEIIPYFQPIISMSKKGITGVEVLARGIDAKGAFCAAG